jgi:thioredoxin 1
MQKTMTRTIGIFTLVLFVMSVTGAAATCTPAKAYNDNFNFSPSKYSGNVLSNDKGTSIKVVNVSKTSKSGKVTMKSNGVFSYSPASSSKTTIQDSFTYRIVNKCGQYSSAKVTINYKKSQGTTGTGSVVEITQLDQINTALGKGPVLLEIGAEWCPCCKKLKPVMQEIAKDYKGKVTIMSADIDKSPKFIDNFGIESIPDTCVIVSVKNGKYVYMQQNGKTTTDRSQARIIGYDNKEVFEKVINLALKQ